MKDLTQLGAVQARAGILRRDFTALDLTRACLARIASRDQAVKAWLCLNPQAEAEAKQIEADDPRPLAGLPIGVKDVFATAQMPTTYNSPLYAHHQPAGDAAVVMMLRAAGAIILGKTDTTEFAAAGRDAATCNPRQPAHTPGGSSAGSAAAVADCHVPLAIATQTGGSTIRPASFCGIYGMKPSFGLISTEGLKPYAPSFDTVGFHARHVEDMALLAGVFDLPDNGAVGRITLGLCHTPYHDRLTQPMIDALTRAANLPCALPFTLPADFAQIDSLHRQIMFAEGAAAFLPLAQTQPGGLHQDFCDRVNSRTSGTMRAAFSARDRLTELAMQLEMMMADAGIAALLAPAAPGTAPLGRIPGNPLFNAIWTALQMPCIALPAGCHEGLPVGLQLVGPRASDAGLLRIAATIAPQLLNMETPFAPT
jgi:Asp-tRNA(Asn)/Glu-tRNA(Gln) amidotransferase A subunit family amidase